MTQEEKNKRYDEALERAKKLQKTCDSTAVVGWCEYIFPELKESEDEKIREWCISHFKECINVIKDNDEYKEYLSNKVLAWLEKQGKHAEVEPKFNVGDWVVLPLGVVAHIDSINSTDYQVTTTDGKICDFKISKQDNYRLWSINDAKRGDVLVDVYGNIGIFDKCYDFDWMSCCSLGNNGGFQHFTVEHENEKTYPATKEQYNLFFSKMKEAGWEWDCEKKELKQSADEAESKFHEGDWIIDNEYGEVLKVTKSDANSYEITNQDGEVFDILKEDVECNHRLWTFEDAKDGDVLVDEDNNIGLYREEKDDLYWHSYIYIGCDNCFRGFGGYHNYENTKPATKEQRDLLFTKMKEAGYELDGDKKELKRIESKMLDADKVIAWLKTNVYDDSAYGKAMIDKFKKDFKLC